MLHRCTVGSCSCCHGGSFTTSHHSPSPANSPSFSFFLSAPGSHDKQPIPSFNGPYDLDHSHVSNYSSPVDCTLSLGTPSTRSSSGYDTERRSSAAAAAGSCMPNFCWDLLQPLKHDSSFAANSNSNGSSGGNNGCGSGNESLLARRCVNCDTTSTPLWRNGPRGPKSLCNACGIRFKKEERRAAAATTAGSGASGLPPSTPPHTFNSHSSWIHTHATTQSHKMTPSCFITTAIGNELLFSNDDGRAGQDSEISFLSWRLNVSDRPGLVHDFTR